ncbi:hypothetical protein PR202_ga22415 [Eleusine coracana subsp. coracana]|uniref:Uncharacterized protein n=1 Tax=Eleusine coracana subsp. coracana TaxID=191504 RepID=A0AAV5D472_ELECO|nr:hypothetical protein QOZ80_9AG0688390 [Eleusine coracana subsp. coracana]GJN04840.1 hypothetical protein PR202_ga22415 [Eleusine coracana subsp. coracana]
MSHGCTGEKKTSWPEVVGKPAKEAVEVIKKDFPEADIHVLPSGSPVTLDFRTDRVRVFLDTVVRIPVAELEPEGNKSSWPELVGKSLKEAKEVILKDKPNAIIQVLTPFDPETREFHPNRVRIFIDTVSDTPVVG